MRIVGGKYKGLQLQEPYENSSVRPTTDRVREALASVVLSHFNLDLCNVSLLDAFAGSGAVGCELLSRGVKSAVFFEIDGCQVHLVKSNIAKMKEVNPEPDLDKTVQICRGNALELAKKSSLVGAPFNLIYLDPPYALDPPLSQRLLATLVATNNVAKDALVIREHAKGSPTLNLAEAGGWDLVKQKAFGTIELDILIKQCSYDGCP